MTTPNQHAASAGCTAVRSSVAFNEAPFDALRQLILIETRPQDILKMLLTGAPHTRAKGQRPLDTAICISAAGGRILSLSNNSSWCNCQQGRGCLRMALLEPPTIVKYRGHSIRPPLCPEKA